MAPLIDDARAARAEAQRLRGDAHELTARAHANLRTTEARKEAAQAEVARARRRWYLPCASPWSTLAWRRDDEALHTVLVPLD